MRYRSTRQLVEGLRAAGQLIEIDSPVDPRCELAEIHRRVNARGGPALLFSNVSGCSFPVASNLLGPSTAPAGFFAIRLKACNWLFAGKCIPKRSWPSRGNCGAGQS